jgi:hypothetical protein
MAEICAQGKLQPIKRVNGRNKENIELTSGLLRPALISKMGIASFAQLLSIWDDLGKKTFFRAKQME